MAETYRAISLARMDHLVAIAASRNLSASCT